jgi:hypothetical protein
MMNLWIYLVFALGSPLFLYTVQTREYIREEIRFNLACFNTASEMSNFLYVW